MTTPRTVTISPVRYPKGMTNSSPTGLLHMYPEVDHTKVYTRFTDFSQYVAGDWTVTNTTSHATIALTAGVGGILSLAGGGLSVANDLAGIQENPFTFNFASGKKVWFKARLNVETALNNQLMFGLTTSNAAATATDGIYFNKAAAAATVDFVVEKSSTATTQSAVATLADATYAELGFYYNGKSEIQVYLNDVKVYSQTTLTNLPSAVSLGLGVVTMLAATAPTTSILLVDYIFAAQEK